MRSFVFAFIIFIVSILPAYALPTPSVRSLLWDYEEGTDISGFFIYYTLKSEPTPRVYIDARKLRVSPLKRQITLLSLKPDAGGEICFRMTVYKTKLSGDVIESIFGPESCGDFGIVGVSSLEIK